MRARKGSGRISTEIARKGKESGGTKVTNYLGWMKGTKDERRDGHAQQDRKTDGPHSREEGERDNGTFNISARGGNAEND